MKFKVRLGEQAYNVNLGGNPFNLLLLPTTVVGEVTDYIDAYLISNSQIFDASDYGIDGFSKLTLESYWIDTCMYMAEDTEPCSGAPELATKIFYPESTDYEWVASDWRYLCDQVLYTGLGGIFLEGRLADGTTTYWKFSGAFYPALLSNFVEFEDYNHFMAYIGDWVDIHCYDAIVSFELLESSNGLSPNIVDKDPFCSTYGKAYFGSINGKLEYIGYEFMDEGNLTTYCLSDGYIDFDVDHSRIRMVIPY